MDPNGDNSQEPSTITSIHAFSLLCGTKADFKSWLRYSKDKAIFQSHIVFGPWSMDDDEEDISEIFEYFSKLPKDVQTRVIQCMEIVEIISFSLCSTNTKSLVKSLNLKPRYFDVTVSGEFEISMRFEAGSELIFEIQNGKIDVDVIYDEGEMREDYVWRNLNFNGKYWMDHLMEVTNHREISHFAIQKNLALEDFQNLVNAIPIRHLIGQTQLENQNFHRILSAIPSPERISVVNGPVSPTVLLQNFEAVKLGNLQSSYTPHLTLDDLTLINSSRIKIYVLNFSQKVINRLLKSWIKGSFPRLEYLKIHFSSLPRIDRNVVLKGLDYQNVPEERILERNPLEYRIEPIRNRMTFRNKSGTKIATISIEYMEFFDFSILELFVSP